jgi:hypothetical protein
LQADTFILAESHELVAQQPGIANRAFKIQVIVIHPIIYRENLVGKWRQKNSLMCCDERSNLRQIFLMDTLPTEVSEISGVKRSSVMITCVPCSVSERISARLSRRCGSIE